MNILKGKIVSVVTHDNLSLVNINIGKTRLTSVIIETPKTADYLKEGNEINVLFKETEVIIGKNINHNISLQNRFSCTIKNIVRGKLLSRLELNFNDLNISSIITTNAVNQLDLKQGEEVVAMVKTNEIMLSE